MAGKLLLSTKIAPNGEVAWADLEENSGINIGVAQCILRSVRDAQFEPPGPDGCKLKIPLTLGRAGKELKLVGDLTSTFEGA